MKVKLRNKKQHNNITQITFAQDMSYAYMQQGKRMLAPIPTELIESIER